MSEENNLEGDNGKDCPLISVVMSVYNGEKYLVEAVDSILAQTFTNFELIVIDDGSTDESRALINSYQDNRILVIENKNNIGLAASLNEGIDIARGKYIARMDCDDISERNRLALQYEYMESHPETVVSGSSANFIEQNGVVVCTYYPAVEDAKLRAIFPGSPFVHPSVIFRKCVFFQAGKYPEYMRWGGEDPVLFARMAKFGSLHNIMIPLVNYRLVPGAMSRKPPLFRSLLTQIINDEINGYEVKKETIEALQDASQQLDKSNTIFDYHFEVAKLYIWSGGSRVKARKHLNECFEGHYSLLSVALMSAVLFMPKKWIKYVYFNMKKRRFIAPEDFY